VRLRAAVCFAQLTSAVALLMKSVSDNRRNPTTQALLLLLLLLSVSCGPAT